MSSTGVATRTRSRATLSTTSVKKPVKHLRSTRRHPLPSTSAPIPAELRGKRKLSGDDVPSKRLKSNPHSSADGDSSMTSQSGQISGVVNANNNPASTGDRLQVPPTATPSKASSSEVPVSASAAPHTQPPFTPLKTAPSMPAVVNSEAGPSTPRQILPSIPSAIPSTPAAQISHPQPMAPTPARELLRLNIDELKSTAGAILPRPPTPPKATERSARNGYPAWATPKTTVKKPPSAFFTRQALTAARPGIRAPMMPVQPVPFDIQPLPPFQHRPDRQVAPLPDRGRPGPSSTPEKQSNLIATPGTKKITVPVPFGGSVSRNTQATANRVLATPSKSVPSDRSLPLPGTPGLSPTEPSAPMTQMEQSKEMEVDAATTSPTADGTMTGTKAEDSTDGMAADTSGEDREVALSKEPPQEVNLSGGSGIQPPVTPAPIPSAPPPTMTSTSRTLRKRAPTVSKSLPARRPHSRPVSACGTVMGPPAVPSATKTSTADPPNKVSAGPRYPSSLGSGPMNRPASRVVSNNYRSISAPTPSSTKAEDASVRSLSYPAGREREANKDKENATQNQAKTKPRESFSMSSRRADTSLCISSLDDTLARLKSRNKPDFKAAPKRVLSAAPGLEDKGDRAKPLCSTSRPALAPMRHAQERHSAPSRFQVLMDNSRQTAVLKGVVAFVDVHSAEGTDGSAPFIDMLKLSGARVLKRASESCTHIIYKDGKPSTGGFWRRLPEAKRPEVVGIKWVTMCRERGKWVDEAPYRVDLNEQELFQVKRKSMEPKRLEAKPLLAKLATAKASQPQPKAPQPKSVIPLEADDARLEGEVGEGNESGDSMSGRSDHCCT